METRHGLRSQLFGHNENAAKLAEAKVQRIQPIKRAVFGDLGNRNANRVDNLPKGGIHSKEQSQKLKEIVSKKSETTSNVLPTENEKLSDAEVEDLSKAFSSNLLNVEDIDADDGDNPQLVSNYVKDIYKYLWDLEDSNVVSYKFLQGHQISSKMRAVLIDWLVQVQIKFSLLQETLYMTVAIMDRFLEADNSIIKERLQLVGVTSMFIASKYEEMYIPEIGDFAYITAKTFTAKEIREMEIHILSVLNFNLAFPLPLHFLRRNSKATQVDGKQHTLAKYFLELTLTEYSFCGIKPSKIAAAASYLALKLTKDPYGWTETAQYHSKYSEEELLPLVCRLSCLIVKGPSQTKTIREKYSSSKLMKISACEEAQPTNSTLRAYALKAASLK